MEKQKMINWIFIKSYLKKAYHYLISYWNSYEYKDDYYPDTFLNNYPKKNIILNEAPKVIYVFWTGNNSITPNRKKGLQSLIDNSSVTVKLITPKNLDKYILKDHPLHPAYKYLSLNHRSDYLRAYFMLHYGGGYADIKTFNKSWLPAFNKLNRSKDKWCIGYREKWQGGVAFNNGKLGKDLVNNYHLLVGNGAYIYKPNNLISRECIIEIEDRLDAFHDTLKENPAEDPFGKNPNYPIPWNYMGGHIVHPLILKYHDKVLFSRDLRPLKVSYR